MTKEEFIKKNSVEILAGMVANGEWFINDLSVKINMVKIAVEISEILYDELRMKNYEE